MNSSAATSELERFMKGLKQRTPHEPEFHQAVAEFAASVMPWYLDHEAYRQDRILERITEPDRIISFRVTWLADDGTIRSNRAWRVQFNNSLGPYKGGLRFHESVTESVLKFLGFEQIIKNSLTGLPMGGAKGGSNFNPRGKSDREIMRFCQSMMSELQNYIGTDMDVPAGDIGVHDREIGYLFGQYMRLNNRWSGVLTSKGCSFGGSAVRNEATGYGCVAFCELMLHEHGSELKDKRLAISGSGTVALYAAEKAIEKGAKVVTLSDSDGCIVSHDGIGPEELDCLLDLKLERRGRLAEFAEQFDSVGYRGGANPWDVACDVAMPCATQNELTADDAEALIDNGVAAVCEGANMPVTTQARKRLRDKEVLFAPGKAANAGGVAVSGLEQSQNFMRVSWTREQISERLQEIMREIHSSCLEHAKPADGAPTDYTRGANIAGFRRVADAMHAYGAI